MESLPGCLSQQTAACGFSVSTRDKSWPRLCQAAVFTQTLTHSECKILLCSLWMKTYCGHLGLLKIVVYDCDFQAVGLFNLVTVAHIQVASLGCLGCAMAQAIIYCQFMEAFHQIWQKIWPDATSVVSSNGCVHQDGASCVSPCFDGGIIVHIVK